MKEDSEGVKPFRNQFVPGLIKLKRVYRRREGPAGFEDGTNSYLGIAALPHGFALIQRLGGFAAIQERTALLTRCPNLPSQPHHGSMTCQCTLPPPP